MNTSAEQMLHPGKFTYLVTVILPAKTTHF